MNVSIIGLATFITLTVILLNFLKNRKNRKVQIDDKRKMDKKKIKTRITAKMKLGIGENIFLRVPNSYKN